MVLAACLDRDEEFPAMLVSIEMMPVLVLHCGRAGREAVTIAMVE